MNRVLSLSIPTVGMALLLASNAQALPCSTGWMDGITDDPVKYSGGTVDPGSVASTQNNYECGQPAVVDNNSETSGELADLFGGNGGDYTYLGKFEAGDEDKSKPAEFKNDGAFNDLGFSGGSNSATDDWGVTVVWPETNGSQTYGAGIAGTWFMSDAVRDALEGWNFFAVVKDGNVKEPEPDGTAQASWVAYDIFDSVNHPDFTGSLKGDWSLCDLEYDGNTGAITAPTKCQTTGMLSHFTFWGVNGGQTTDVPAPATMGLLALGLLGMVTFRTRRSRC